MVNEHMKRWVLVIKEMQIQTTEKKPLNRMAEMKTAHTKCWQEYGAPELLHTAGGV